MDNNVKKKFRTRSDRMMANYPKASSSSTVFKNGLKEQRELVSVCNSCASRIMALVPPYDSGSSSSDDEESHIFKDCDDRYSGSSNLISIPRDDLQTNLSDIRKELYSPELRVVSTDLATSDPVLDVFGNEGELRSLEEEKISEELTAGPVNVLLEAQENSVIDNIEFEVMKEGDCAVDLPSYFHLPVSANNVNPNLESFPETSTRGSNPVGSSTFLHPANSLSSLASVSSCSTNMKSNSVNRPLSLLNSSNPSANSKTRKRVASPSGQPGKAKVVKTKACSSQFSWKKEPFQYVVTDIDTDNGSTNTTPPRNISVRKPLQYFSDFFSDDIWDLIVEQTILYSSSLRNNAIHVTRKDIQNFIGISIAMGVVQMPAYTDYWSEAHRFEKIASVMPLKKYQLLRRYMHFVDNTLQAQDSDRYFKIRPLVDIVRKNFLAVEEEGKYSIDEMMVPYKGTRAGSRRQYIQNKPHKWGFKIFVRAGISGMIYDFLLYGGEDTFRQHEFSDAEELLGLGGKVVVALCSSIQKKACSFVFFDNFFSSLELLILLREKYGILSMGTIRGNRLRGCPLIEDQKLAKQGRGSYDMKSCNTNKVCVVKWQDNKSVCLASTFCEVEPLGTIKRREKKKLVTKRAGSDQDKSMQQQCVEPRAKINVPCPNIVLKYNAFMGGVDLADMLIALYRTALRTHRWYLAIFAQIIDMCVCNAWLLYRRDCRKVNIKNDSLKQFRWNIAEKLMAKGKQHSVNHSPTVPATGCPRNQVDEDVRYDCQEHFPQHCEKGRCRYCKNGQTRMECIKCQARLCITKDKNCFYHFHHRKPF